MRRGRWSTSCYTVMSTNSSTTSYTTTTTTAVMMMGVGRIVRGCVRGMSATASSLVTKHFRSFRARFFLCDGGNGGVEVMVRWWDDGGEGQNRGDGGVEGGCGVNDVKITSYYTNQIITSTHKKITSNNQNTSHPHLTTHSLFLWP